MDCTGFTRRNFLAGVGSAAAAQTGVRGLGCPADLLQ
jgi:hypothetical protein